MRRRASSLLKKGAALAAAVLLLASCQQSASVGKIVHENIPFSEITYERPDLDGINKKIDQAVDWAKKGGKQKETLELYDEILADLRNYDKMSTVASIHNDLDLSDSYYEDENAFLEENYTKLDNRMNEVTGAILDSDYSAEAKKEWGGGFVERYEENSKLNSPAIETLSKQEQDLVNEYKKLSVTEYTTEYNGKTVTLNDLDYSSEDIYKPYYEIYEKRNKELGEIYRELCGVRVKIAETLGFSSYADYAYALLKRDFTKEEAAEFSKQVKETLVPLYSTLNAVYAQVSADASAKNGVTLEDGIPILKEALKKGYPQGMSDALSYMMKNEMYDFGDSSNKMKAAFTTAINTLGAPYLFINTAVYQEPGTLFHEFGHYYNFYLMGDSDWNDSNNLDLAEVHSQGLELLMHNTYEKLYQGQADLFKAQSLLNIMGSVLQGCAEDEFQQAVFENPEMSLEQMNLLHAQIYEEYMGYPLIYEWVDIHHHYETPFYYISYATSAISALEIWEIASSDRKQALDIYDKITKYTLNAGYRTALTESGLSDPFHSDCVARVGDALKKSFEEFSFKDAA